MPKAPEPMKLSRSNGRPGFQAGCRSSRRRDFRRPATSPPAAVRSRWSSELTVRWMPCLFGGSGAPFHHSPSAPFQAFDDPVPAFSGGLLGECRIPFRFAQNSSHPCGGTREAVAGPPAAWRQRISCRYPIPSGDDAAGCLRLLGSTTSSAPKLERDPSDDIAAAASQ